MVNTVLCTWKLLKVDLLGVLTTRTKGHKGTSRATDVSATLIVAMASRYVHIPKIIQLYKLNMCDFLYINSTFNELTHTTQH